MTHPDKSLQYFFYVFFIIKSIFFFYNKIKKYSTNKLFIKNETHAFLSLLKKTFVSFDQQSKRY